MHKNTALKFKRTTVYRDEASEAVESSRSQTFPVNRAFAERVALGSANSNSETFSYCNVGETAPFVGDVGERRRNCNLLSGWPSAQRTLILRLSPTTLESIRLPLDNNSAGNVLPAVPHDLAENRSDLLGASLACVSETVGSLRLTCKPRCNLRLPPDRKWGTLNPDGTWTGMVGEVVAGRAEFVVATLDSTVERARVVDSLIPISTTWTSLYMKAGSQFGSPWIRYTEEFSPSAWIVLLAVVITTTIILYLVMHRSPGETVTWELSETLLIVTGLFASQGFCGCPVNVSVRIFLLTVIALAILAQTYYSAFLYAKLSDTRRPVPFRTIQAIIDDGSYTFGMMIGASIQGEFLVSKDPLLRRLYDEFTVPKGLFSEFTDVFKRLENERYIAALNMLSVEAETRLNPCRLIRLPIKMFAFKAGFALRKKSPYKKIFNNA
ncbi:glutamate receptor 1-like [Hyalella azteca]|uniref:Glutamate receptor 1-like n=1 Tax=Hyalella azteca TaxID=294128 RepID=A0A8B7PHF8_HYAAZ|nr:glutamate receptor 1-like [Hyalella azteca]